MREIKFRIWDGEVNEYVKDGWSHGFQIYAKTNIQGPDPLGEIYEQFTGLRDKNGKEIYEGDIVSQFIGKSYSTGPAVVEYIITEYHCGYYIRGLELGIERCETCEVIGNIHETPELLK